MKILVLEDYSPQIEALRQMLEAEGHEVALTDNTSYALAYTRRHAPDLLVAALFPTGEADETESGLSVAMAAQFHNPRLQTVLLSSSLLFSHGELFAMLDSLRCVLPRPAPLADLFDLVSYLAQSPRAEAQGCSCRMRGWGGCVRCQSAPQSLLRKVG